MRLIDADELTNVMTQDWFLDILITQNGKSDLKKKLVDMIDSVPLAYDVEKVVAELNDILNKSEKYLNDFSQGQALAYLHAIDIVTAERADKCDTK
jgi:hypothetical protein